MGIVERGGGGGEKGEAIGSEIIGSIPGISLNHWNQQQYMYITYFYYLLEFKIPKNQNLFKYERSEQ